VGFEAKAEAVGSTSTHHRTYLADRRGEQRSAITVPVIKSHSRTIAYSFM
jgi:hypothetical protein